MRVPRKKLAELVSFVAAAEGTTLGQIDIGVVGRRQMAQLNRHWLGRAGTTDVLCFDLSDAHSRGISAQLVVCGHVAAERGGRSGTGPQRELMLYVVHGLLHLMGYDDRSVRGAAKMRAREEELVGGFVARRSQRRDRSARKGTSGKTAARQRKGRRPS
jgi:probable rRNA maturation factor